MTDTPAEVTWALHALSDCGYGLAATQVRAHIADLERQLAEAREARQKWYGRYQQQNENWCAAERQIADLQSQLAAQRERDGRLCALLEAAIGPAGADFCMNPELEAHIQAALKDRRP